MGKLNIPFKMLEKELNKPRHEIEIIVHNHPAMQLLQAKINIQQKRFELEKARHEREMLELYQQADYIFNQIVRKEASNE